MSEKFLQSHPYLKESAVVIKGQALATDSVTLYEPPSAIELIGSDMTRRAARLAYQQASLTPQDVQIVELHDCFTTNEMCALEGLGLAAEGEAWKLVDKGGITYAPGNAAQKKAGPGWIVNPSGGLISKGHPLGATGLAQTTELGLLERFLNVVLLLLTRAFSMASTRMGEQSVCPRHQVLSPA